MVGAGGKATLVERHCCFTALVMSGCRVYQPLVPLA